MKLIKCFLEKNDCYKANKKITVTDLMLHSTGANNPNLKRYVQPNVNGIGNNPNSNDWNRPTPDGKKVCVHGFIGKLENGDVATVQTLPWNMRGWHSGGSANDTHIGIEICEDNLKDKNYFNAVYKEAVEVFSFLCKEYKLDPLKNIICHSEGYKKGIASNHADVMHWFPKHGKSMDTFRNDVKAKMEEEAKMTKEITDIKTALDFLEKNGRVTDRSYWEKAIVTTKNVDSAFIKWANDVKKLVN